MTNTATDTAAPYSAESIDEVISEWERIELAGIQACASSAPELLKEMNILRAAHGLRPLAAC